MVRLACERPDSLGRSLSPWDGTELARELIAEGLVEEISPATGRRILASHQRQPGRQHVGLYPKQPRDAAFSASVSELIALYTQSRRREEMVLSVDETTALPPRPRLSPPLPAQPQHSPHRPEHAYTRAGALNLLAAFDPRSGTVYGQGDARKRQRAFMAFLEVLEAEIDECIRLIHLVCDPVSTHQGKALRTW